jgi:hypothetical protein
MTRRARTVALLAGAFVASCTGGSHAATKALTWLVPRYVVRAFGSDPVAAATFSGPHTFLIARPGQTGGDGDDRHAVLTVSYRSYADIERAFAEGSAPRSGAILYDNEKWSFTPDDEKADPARYERLAAEVVHAHHLLFIATPAIALSAALDRGPGTVADKYLRLGMAGDAARDADVFDIQAQSLQYDTTAYAALVARAAAQARAANPHVVVVAGLTTGRAHPDGSAPTADDLLRAVHATRGEVDGYWLNVPNAGPDCPQCSDFRPDIALDFLHRLVGGGTTPSGASFPQP